MKYVILTLMLVLNACGDQPLLRDGDYGVSSNIVAYHCVCGPPGSTVSSEGWVYRDNTLKMLDSEFQMKEDGRRLTHYRDDQYLTFGIELTPNEKGDGFKGIWYLDWPDLILHVVSVEGKLK